MGYFPFNFTDEIIKIISLFSFGHFSISFTVVVVVVVVVIIIIIIIIIIINE